MPPTAALRAATPPKARAAREQGGVKTADSSNDVVVCSTE
jgi:hypothetical protein